MRRDQRSRRATAAAGAAAAAPGGLGEAPGRRPPSTVLAASRRLAVAGRLPRLEKAATVHSRRRTGAFPSTGPFFLTAKPGRGPMAVIRFQAGKTRGLVIAATVFVKTKSQPTTRDLPSFE